MGSQKIKVLLIEDNPLDAAMVKSMLTPRPEVAFELVHVDSLEKGLAQLKKGCFDALLLDLILPDSSGIETFEQVYNHTSDLPIVVLTALDDQELALQAVKLGSEDYLVKGKFDAELFARSIRYAIERHRMTQVLRSLSFLDELTGLYNRRGFFTLAQQQLKLAWRAKRPLLLFYIDLDGLKSINDTYGHRAGDQALLEIAQVLRETFRTSDVLGRIGGDEFVVLAIDATKDKVATIRERLARNLEALNQTKKYPYSLALSLGTSSFDPEEPASIEDLLTVADRTLYQEKESKKKQA